MNQQSQPPMKPAAEFEMDPATARGLIESQFPEFAGAPIAPFGDGWDNTAFLARDTVFRFPRREIAAGLLASEERVLPGLAKLGLPLAVPDPRYVGRPAGAYPWMFLGYPRLPGRTACAARLDPGQRLAAVEPLARFLRELHAIPGDRARSWGAPGDEINRLDFEERTAWAVKRLRRIEELGLLPGALRMAAEFRDPPPVRGPGVLVHGDLYARHLLVDDAGTPCGVIDWGDVHVGHPAVDLSMPLMFLPPDALPGFLDGYGGVDADTLRLARLRAIHHAAATLLAARETNDADLFDECLGSLTRLAAR